MRDVSHTKLASAMQVAPCLNDTIYHVCLVPPCSIGKLDVTHLPISERNLHHEPSFCIYCMAKLAFVECFADKYNLALNQTMEGKI